MFATAEGTQRYVDRHADYRDAGFYRTILDLQVSSLGIGTYLGKVDDESDRRYIDALVTAGSSGINFFDTAINYRNQHSEWCIASALKRLQRDEIVVCTKAGYITPGAVPEYLPPSEIIGGIHSLSPKFLLDQIERSLTNLEIDTIDVFYIHNPEAQLSFSTREEFDTRIRRAFAHMEQVADKGKIRWYGVATWDGLRKRDKLSLERLAEIALQEGGRDNRFRFVQLPLNLAMVEAFLDQTASSNLGQPETVLEAAARLGKIVVASASLMQAHVLSNFPEAASGLIPGLHTNAQRAIQFTRSTPGVSVALVGMSRREHVVENLGVAAVPPSPVQQYMRLYAR